MKVTDDILSNELESTERLNQLEKYKTALKKVQFINEIKGGLGDEIKLAPNEIKIIKKPWYKKISKILRKIFTKF